jgi:phosphatidate cytidylyltransferase
VEDNRGLTPPDPDKEGVRIIGPEEAAEAVERGEVASRRSDRGPRYGDRPPRSEAQPKGPRPTLRFPLPDSPESEEFARPKVKPPTDMSNDESTRRSLFSVSEPGGTGDDDPTPDDSAWDGPDDSSWDGPEDSSWDGVEHPEELAASSGGWDHQQDQDAEDSDVSDDEMGSFDERPADVVRPEVPERPSEADRAGVRLPHWTDPATGEIPAVLGGGDDDADAWPTFSGGGPRWRDDSRDYDERDDVAALGDDEERLGALDPDAPGEQELLSFDDLGATPEVARPPQTAPAKKKKKKKKKAPPAAAGTRPGAPRGARPGTRPGGPGERPPGGPPPRRPEGSAPDLTTRLAVGGAFALVALVLLNLGPGWMMVLVTALTVLAAAEFFTTTRRAGFQPAQLLGIVACAALPLAAFAEGTMSYPVVLGLTGMCGFVWYIIGAGEERPTMNLGVTLLGVVWVGVLASFAGLLLGAPDGASLLLSVLLVAVANDVGAYFVGRSFGRAPLTAISPHKTIEGFAGGIGASVVMAVVVVNAIGGIGPFGDSLGDAFLLGLVVGLATAVGDLCESVLKRDLGVKDMGNILPGHGGVLDRLDGVLFALPAAWYLGLLIL